MKRFALVVLLVALAVPAFAQGMGGGMIGPDRLLGGTVEELTEKLALTEEQVPKLQEVFDETESIMMEAIQALRDQGGQGGGQGGGGGFSGMRAAFEALRDDQRHAVRAVLDEKQTLAYDQLLAEADVRSSGFGGGFGGRGGRGSQNREEEQKARIDRAMKSLGLTGEDETMVRGLLEKMAEIEKQRAEAWTNGRVAIAKLLVDKASTDEALDAALDEMRSQAKEFDGNQKEARKLLKEALTSRQEADLVSQGILDK